MSCGHSGQQSNKSLNPNARRRRRSILDLIWVENLEPRVCAGLGPKMSYTPGSHEHHARCFRLWVAPLGELCDLVQPCATKASYAVHDLDCHHIHHGSGMRCGLGNQKIDNIFIVSIPSQHYYGSYSSFVEDIIVTNSNYDCWRTQICTRAFESDS